MADAYGIKETVEFFAAAGVVAVVAYMAQKQATGPDGKVDVQKLATALATLLMTNPQVITDLKAAAANISDVPKELCDLTLMEGLTLTSECGKIAARCVAEIRA